MQIQDHDKFPKFDHQVLPPASRRSLGEFGAAADRPGHPRDGRQSRKLGKFQMTQVGRIRAPLKGVTARHLRLSSEKSARDGIFGRSGHS